MTLRVLVPVAISAVALCAATAAGSRPGPGETCEARPIVEQFFAALKAGDLATLDSLFAGEQEEWRWYSISDRGGPAARGRGVAAEARCARTSRRGREARAVPPAPARRER